VKTLILEGLTVAMCIAAMVLVLALGSMR